ncbi:MAG: hypothetical protein ACM3X9_01530 [Bacillota bacterium]
MGRSLVYFSTAIFLASILGIITLVLLAIPITGYLKIFEEQRLWRDFGEEYREYQRAVSMITPWPKNS